ncbi:MYG1 family protein [Anaerotruncus rubiinfantis]|uniref:MYG1 family protein n=1 Tax=Anaerotruncus rubiinfantis TaxID=1720200 RepID=UPI0034A194C4
MTDKIVPSRAVTHAGKFHADDVFSTALLRILNPSIEIARVQRIPEGYHWFAYDIGWGEFDHHQQNAPVRENGIPYAAFGLLWRTFGPQVLSGRDVEAFDKHFVQPLDLDDNTGCGDPIAEIIGNFNPAWDSSEPEDACFWQAVDFAQVILEKRFAAVRAICRAKQLVAEAIAAAKDGIVVLPRYAPWKSAVYRTAAVFVVYPSQRGGFSAQGVPDDETGALKCPFPLGWAGKSEAELPALTGLSSLRFCHNNRFLVAADQLSDAVAACRIALDEQKKEENR